VILDEYKSLICSRLEEIAGADSEEEEEEERSGLISKETQKHLLALCHSFLVHYWFAATRIILEKVKPTRYNSFD
jgi:hypothetical protein